MLRLLLFVILLLGASIAMVQLADIPGELLMTIGEWRVETTLLFALFAFTTILLASIFIFHFITRLISAPSRIMNRYYSNNQERGLSVLTEAFAALAVSDISNARKLTHKAEKLLGNPPITQLMAAQLAKMEGDDDLAVQRLKPLLEHKETQFIAARSLLEQARKAGEIEKALDYAETAESIRPDSSYATLALIDLYTHTKSWQKALDVLRKAKRHGALTKPEVQRYTAFINYQHAVNLYERDDDELALSFGKMAHKALPNMVPAAHLLARIYDKSGQKQHAARVLNQTWRLFPHPSLSSLLRRIFAEEPADKRLKRVEKMVASTQGDIESQIAIAEAALEARDFSKARNHLKTALSQQETPRICKLMGRLEDQESQNKEKADMWMERAVKANIGPSWTCINCHAIPDHWALHCPECDSFDSIEWKINRLNFVDIAAVRETDSAA